VANSRRRKCYIFSLETVEGEIYEPSELSKHIEGYYKELFGSEERGSMRLQEDMREGLGSLSEEEAASLVEPFSELEIKVALEEMKPNSAPGPYGLPSNFYKIFWEQIMSPVIEMFDKFHRGS
jgi:hypothetical protein